MSSTSEAASDTASKAYAARASISSARTILFCDKPLWCEIIDFKAPQDVKSKHVDAQSIVSTMIAAIDELELQQSKVVVSIKSGSGNVSKEDEQTIDFVLDQARRLKAATMEIGDMFERMKDERRRDNHSRTSSIDPGESDARCGELLSECFRLMFALYDLLGIEESSTKQELVEAREQIDGVWEAFRTGIRDVG